MVLPATTFCSVVMTIGRTAKDSRLVRCNSMKDVGFWTLLAAHHRNLTPPAVCGEACLVNETGLGKSLVANAPDRLAAGSQHDESQFREESVIGVEKTTPQKRSGRLSVKIRRQQASASAGWPALRCKTALRKCSSASSGSSRRPSAQRAERRGKIAEHLVAAGDQGEELAHDRIFRAGPTQAALKISQGGPPILPLEDKRASSASRILRSRWSFRSRSAGSV